eukprot:7916436-Alexandrium_andersonii.AAC.1
MPTVRLNMSWILECNAALMQSCEHEHRRGAYPRRSTCNEGYLHSAWHTGGAREQEARVRGSAKEPESEGA